MFTAKSSDSSARLTQRGAAPHDLRARRPAVHEIGDFPDIGKRHSVFIYGPSRHSAGNGYALSTDLKNAHGTLPAELGCTRVGGGAGPVADAAFAAVRRGRSIKRDTEIAVLAVAAAAAALLGSVHQEC
jgi:hypothetical protein